MEIYIKVFFRNEDNTPAVGLTPLPTVVLRKTVDKSLVLDNVLMDEVGEGWYKYLLTNYSPDIDYSGRGDGGIALGSNRYVPISSLPDFEDMILKIIKPTAKFN
jgi:hypothetical protein